MAGRSFSKSGGWSTHSVASYRSGLEEKMAAQLESQGVPAVFEQYEVTYVIPESTHKYTPDFILPNGIVIEGKGIFDVEDRKKHQLIKEQYPDMDIRFVFTNPNAKLYKGSPTSYAAWCTKFGFKYAAKVVPTDWLKETGKGLHPALTLKAKYKKGGSK